MVICRFFQNGYCRFGDTCRFEHPRVGGGGGGGGGGGSSYGGGGGGSGYGGGEHYGNQGRSEGYNSPARYGQSPTRHSNYENRADYRNDSRGGYGTNYRSDQRTDYRSDQRTDYRNDQRTDYRNDNRSNNINDSRSGHRGDNRTDFRSENRFTALDNQHEGSRQHDGYQRGGGGGGGGRQYDARYSYRSDQRKKEGDSEELTPAEILENITEDMEMWETGKMWLFSCYGYAREVKSFPGLDDLSADEIRLKAYEANASGSVIAHVNWLSHLAEDYQAKRAALRKPDPNARSALLNLIEDIKRSSLQTASSKTAFTGGARLFTSETNAFGATTPAPNAFGAATPATNTFGAATNAFGAATPAANTFGAVRPPPNAFGAATPTNAFSSSAYGGTVQPGFSMATSTPIMPTSANAFGLGANTPHNTFSPAGTSEGFLPASNVGFGRTTNPQSANQQTPSSQSSSVKLIGLYTPVTELTAEEKAEFENAKFTLDHVPLRPPPKDMI